MASVDSLLSLLSTYSNPPKNYVGTFLFISYIVSALELTSLLTGQLFMIYEKWTSKQPQSLHPSPQHILLFASLAVLSFSLLSYNMLAVLFTSYINWCDRTGVKAGFAFSEISSDLMPKLWAWTTGSTLFEDFARDLVADGREGWFWTGSALAFTLGICETFGRIGTERNVPHLWAYFLLGQILPISFTQNLFYITLLLLPRPSPELKSYTTTSLPTIITPILTLLSTPLLILLPSTLSTPWFLPLALLLRILMLVPLLPQLIGLHRYSVKSKPSRNTFSTPMLVVLGVFAVHAGWKIARGEWSLQGLWESRGETPAARAVVWDAGVGVVSAGLWWVVGVVKEAGEERKRR
ncbi:MAG: hypothetical protein M1820_003957 [Bogoriella megaspora]|nr:MAG: hypothetical protein M1820_003957 [Bogoriella megaspora]